MDEATIRDHVQKHADAVANGDIEAVTEDFTESMRPQVPQLAGALPNPVASAEVLSVEPGDPTIAQIKYTGQSGDTTTIRSEWQDEDGRPRIVGGGPVE
jgi:ketosteroid isomerase-like protein